jgi:coiled-coil domain-containing protein 64
LSNVHVQVNSQLMEAVQQKVALSQQLDQWQQDVQELLSENMTKKMAGANRNRSGAESDSSQPEKRKASRIMSFLKLGSA